MDHKNAHAMGTVSEGVSAPNRGTKATETAGQVTVCDSGWIGDSNSSSHTFAFPNNLGSIPQGLELSFSPDGGGTVYSVAYRWWDNIEMNPVTVQVSAQQILLEIVGGPALFGVWTPTAGWTNYLSGYWKAVYWKVS
jgi:hypothetical protein